MTIFLVRNSLSNWRSEGYFIPKIASPLIRQSVKEMLTCLTAESFMHRKRCLARFSSPGKHKCFLIFGFLASIRQHPL
jgi:hypothetical protein